MTRSFRYGIALLVLAGCADPARPDPDLPFWLQESIRVWERQAPQFAPLAAYHHSTPRGAVYEIGPHGRRSEFRDAAGTHLCTTGGIVYQPNACAEHLEGATERRQVWRHPRVAAAP